MIVPASLPGVMEKKMFLRKKKSYYPLPQIAYWVTIYGTIRLRVGLLHTVLRHGHLGLLLAGLHLHLRPGLLGLLQKKQGLLCPFQTLPLNSSHPLWYAILCL